MIGSIVSHYRILEKLGGGGMGVVYRAQDLRLEREVAIKFLTNVAEDDEEAKERFRLEAKLASALDHPNICAIHEIDETPEGRLFIVMSYYPGVPLNKRLEAGVHIGEVLDFAIQICAGVAKAHERRIIHRDLKPQNAILTADGTIKILDFGLARTDEGHGLTRTGQSMGSPNYMSPEQVRGDTVTHQTDLWSIGIILYEMLSGAPPFHRGSIHATINAILTEKPAPLPLTVPASLRDLVSRCLDPVPSRRPATAAALYEELVQIRQEVIEGTTFSPAESFAPTVIMTGEHATPHKRFALRKRHAALVASALVVGMLLVLAAQRLWHPTPPRPLRVAVLPPAAKADTSGTTPVIATNVHTSLLRGLTSMQGIAPVDPGEVRETNGSFEQVVKALAVDEVIRSTLDDRGTEWGVSLERVSAHDGHLIWTQEFSAPKHEPLLVADAVIAYLRQAYPNHSLRGNAVKLEVRPQDYEEFLSLWAENTSLQGSHTHRQTLEKLQELRSTSPNFVGMLILEARVATYVGDSEHEPKFLERAIRVSQLASRMAPQDPRPVLTLFRAAIAAGNLKLADSALQRLAKLNPGDPSLLASQAVLAHARGKKEDALKLLSQAADRLPSYWNLFHLATLEYDENHFDEARGDLERLLARDSTLSAPRNKLAEIELLHGNPARAEELFMQRNRESPTVSSLTNLGLARLLLGKHKAALGDFRAAADRAPNHPYVLLNLADAEMLAGDSTSAVSHYARVLKIIGENKGEPTWDDLSVQAQCYIHMGQKRTAVATIQKALRLAHEETEAYYLAALVYCQAGETESALVNVQRALETGTTPRWFGLPWFDILRDNPDFKALLAKSGAQSGAQP